MSMSRGRLVNRSDQLQVFSLAVEHPVMIVTSTKLQLLVVIPDPSSDRGRLVEIERCAGDGSQLPGWNQTLVDGGELAGLDHQFMPQDVAGSSIFQVEVGMVSKIDNGRLIRLGGVLDLQTVLVRQSVSNRTTEIARKTFFPIFARVGQLERRSVANEQRVRDGDVVIWFNFRADRARQLSIAFLDKDFNGFDREVTPSVHYVTLTQYDKTYGCPVVFEPQSLANILGEVVSKAGLAQLRIAETEKYPHVTYFFNGGVEKQYPGEDRIIVPSPKDVPTYDYKPEMSAPEVTEKVVEALPNYDLVILNFANPDMVGHTGVVEAGIKAVETIDDCVKAVVEKTLSLGGKLLIAADHGNCEQMRNRDGSPNTAHTTNLVHVLYVAEQPSNFKVESGILADVSPTLLFLLHLKQPAEMTGRNLVDPPQN